METWTLSVEKWRKIIDILNRLNINTTSFSKLRGFNKTRVYNNAILLRRNKIPSNHRAIISRTIRKIRTACKGKTSDTVIKINIPKNLCNLIRSQSPTPPS
jgi:hypothetical protein